MVSWLIPGVIHNCCGQAANPLNPDTGKPFPYLAKNLEFLIFFLQFTETAFSIQHTVYNLAGCKARGKAPWSQITHAAKEFEHEIFHPLASPPGQR